MAKEDDKAVPSTDAAWKGENATKFETKAFSEYFDPCEEAAKRSIRCLHRNGGDRMMCGDFFQAYRDCKKQWTDARKEARKKSSWFG